MTVLLLLLARFVRLPCRLGMHSWDEYRYTRRTVTGMPGGSVQDSSSSRLRRCAICGASKVRSGT